MRILIVGCGDVGTAFGVAQAGAGHEVFGLRREPAGLPGGIRPVRADLTRPATLGALPPEVDVVVYTAAPDTSDDAAYQAIYVAGLGRLLAALAGAGRPPGRLVFASSTAVYGGADGGWVDETSPPRPESFRGRRLLEAEGLLAGAPVPATVLRFGGIYGPGRTRLVDRLRRGTAVCVDGPPRYGNRIHRDDCVGVLGHVVALARPAPLYVAVDHEPADECDVLRWLADRMGLPAPPVAPPTEAASRGSKRCRNDRLVASGYRFRHPTYREGYAAVLDARPAPPEGGLPAGRLPRGPER